MTPLPLLDADGVTVGRAALAQAIAAQPIKQHLIHETVVAELAARRAGTHSTKTRGVVRGGGAKPWRQKGTGRARQGSIRAPQWTGGGVAFGPTPRGARRQGQPQGARSGVPRGVPRARRARVAGADGSRWSWETPSTKRAVEYLRQAPDGVAVRPLLLVVTDLDAVEARSFRNLPGVYVLASSELETVDIVAARALLVERAVWERIAGEPAEVEAVEAKRKPKPRAKPKKKAPAPPPVVEEPAPEVAEEPVAAEEPAAEEPVARSPPPRRRRPRSWRTPPPRSRSRRRRRRGARRGGRRRGGGGPQARAEAQAPARQEAAQAQGRGGARGRARGRRRGGLVSTLRHDMRRVIVRPVISEKSFQLVQAHNQYTFRVLDGAHKTEIRQAVEDLFDVTVTDVRTVTVQPQAQAARRLARHRPGWKKAIVELRPGDKIELFEGA